MINMKDMHTELAKEVADSAAKALEVAIKAAVKELVPGLDTEDDDAVIAAVSELAKTHELVFQRQDNIFIGIQEIQND